MSAERVTYLDSSAIVKLVVREAESVALRRYLRGRRPVVASALARVEVLRAVRFQSALAVARSRTFLARIGLVRIDDVLLDAAAALDARVLRSLDAIHLASAQAAGDDLDCVVTYDRRMSEAAGALTLPVRSPGAPWDRPGPRAEARRPPRR